MTDDGARSRRAESDRAAGAEELFPILTTRDLPAALRFYRDLLGGEVIFDPDGNRVLVADRG